MSTDKNERLYQKTQIFNDILEGFIRKRPEQWLWMHRRWKPYKGESRWALSKSFAFSILFLIFGLYGCAGKEDIIGTGISIPEDPTIQVPELSQTPQNEDLTKQKEEISREFPKAKEKKKERKVSKAEIKKEEPKKILTIIPTDKIPFEIGERLEVQLRWTAIPAGKAILEVKEGPEFNGRPTFHLWGNALSSKLVDAIYHVDNTAESFIDKAGFMPYKFLLHMIESKQLKETRVSFDHARGKAFYWSKRISERWGNEELNREDELVPQARDLWSAIYYARALNYELGKKQVFTVYENGKNWGVELEPVAMELITTPVGAFQCFKIRVLVSLNNVLKPMGETYMWLSDDSKKYLVKFDAKIKIGSLNGILTSIKEH